MWRIPLYWKKKVVLYMWADDIIDNLILFVKRHTTIKVTIKDFCHKVRLVRGGYMTDIPTMVAYDSV